MIKKSIFAIASAALTVGFTAVSAEAADVFTLKSTTFADGKLMPKKTATEIRIALAITSRLNSLGPTCRTAPRASFF